MFLICSTFNFCFWRCQKYLEFLFDLFLWGFSFHFRQSILSLSLSLSYTNTWYYAIRRLWVLPEVALFCIRCMAHVFFKTHNISVKLLRYIIASSAQSTQTLINWESSSAQSTQSSSIDALKYVCWLGKYVVVFHYALKDVARQRAADLCAVWARAKTTRKSMSESWYTLHGR